jgi:hypothetical protein
MLKNLQKLKHYYKNIKQNPMHKQVLWNKFIEVGYLKYRTKKKYLHENELCS